MLQNQFLLNYLIKEPKEYSDKTKLMVLLHGYGSNEEDLFSFTPYLPDDFLIISVRAPNNSPYGGYAWYDINFIDLNKFMDTNQAKKSIQIFNDFITEIEKEYTFDKKDIWLCGFSQGAILSYSLAFKYPDRYKHIICLSGYAETNIIDYDNRKDYSQTHFYISHGLEDVVIPAQLARTSNEFMTKNNIDYKYYEFNQGHGINQDNLRSLLNWIENNKE